MRLCGKLVQTHRVAFCAEEGVSIDEISGRVVMHSCDNPSCVNPDHLKVGSHLDNVEDRNGKGRTYRKYSDAEIKSAMQDRSSGMALRDVEAKHGISHQYISKLELGRFTRP